MWQGELIIFPIRNDRNISMRPIRQKGQHRSFGKISQEKISWILRRVVQQGNVLKGDDGLGQEVIDSLAGEGGVAAS